MIAALNFQRDRQQAHDLIDLLPPAKLGAIRGLLEVMIDGDDTDEELTEDDRRALAASRDYFRRGGVGVPFEKVVAESGFTMDQILDK